MTSKTVLITGAAHRIGAAIARELHACGMNIVIHHNQSSEVAASLSDELNRTRSNSAFVVQSDLLEADSYTETITQAHSFNNRLDVLINNASTFFPTIMGEISLQDWQSIIGVNLQAPLFLSQQAAPYLAEHSGCIINLTDIHALRPLKDHSLYSTAKAGLIMLTQSLAKELGPSIRVNGVSPGAILWPENMPVEKKQETLSKVILERKGNLDDITNAIRFLINEADYMTGQILNIDGGRSLHS